MTQVLVVYASRHGSTSEVAERIAARLNRAGHRADVAAADGIMAKVDGYRLVILGGALYNGRWHRDARRFLRRHRDELTGVSVAVFGMGPRRDDVGAWRRSRSQLDRALARYAWLHPVDVTVFGGVDPEPKRGRPRRDLRNWQTIDAWADSLTVLTGA
jgi:menaquinone-dependent protoporphyrinogen oxidase